MHYIKHNEPQSAYALHVWNKGHAYGPISDNMPLLKHIDKPSLLIPYEQLYIRLFLYNNQRIAEQNPNEQNLMYQLIYNRKNTLHPPDLSINCFTLIVV